MVPADGWLAGGFAVVDEQLVARGRRADAEGGRRPGLCRLVRASKGGCIWRSPAPAPPPGRLGSAARWPLRPHRAPAEFALTAQGEAFARRAVGPTLAAAGFGLAVGDLATAAAILRPDYATGPGLGVSMESLRDIAACALEGVVIRDASAFHRIASADVFLFDHHPVLERAGLEVREVQAARRRRRGRRPPARRIGVRRPGRRAVRRPCKRRAAVAADHRPAQPAAQLPRPRDHPPRPGSVITIRDVAARRTGDACSARPWRSRPTGGPSAGSPSGDRPVPRAAEAIRELRRHGPLTIGLISDRPDAEAACARRGARPGLPPRRPLVGCQGGSGANVPPARPQGGLRRRRPARARCGARGGRGDLAGRRRRPAHDPAQVLVLRRTSTGPPACGTGPARTSSACDRFTASSCCPTWPVSPEPSSSASPASRRSC